MFLPYKRYSDFSGRSTRKEYWLFTAFVLTASLGFLGLMLAGGFELESGTNPGGFAGNSTLETVGVGGLIVFWLGTFIPNLAVNVRRFHDRDMSGWWVLGFGVLSKIPYVGWIATIAQLVILALPGTSGPNRFGADPRDPLNVDIFA